MQPIVIKRRKGPSAHRVPTQQLEGAINAIAIHDEPVARVARRAGIGINPLVSDLVDALIEWGTEQYENGFEAGRGPNPPAAPLRPVLMRRAA